MLDRRYLLKGAITLALTASLSSCASYRPAGPAFHAVLNAPYALDSGDRLRITVFEQAGLTNTYLVDKAGYIAFPLVGSIAARGQTIKELEANIARQLTKGYIRNPDVSVEVDRYRPFFIMGEVATSGQYTYVPGMTAQNAIAIAGGFSPRARHNKVDVTRQINGNVVTGSISITDPIMPGDTIYIRERLL